MVTPNASQSLQAWAKDQIEAFDQVRPRYGKYAETLEKILRQAVKKYAPLAIVQVRTKTIASFAGKIQRKRAQYRDPIHQFTDLCGARIITSTADEVRALCNFIETHFDIDWENSIDASQRYKPTEFGYRSVHYIVQCCPGVFSPELPAEVFPDLTTHCPMKAEIQVRTFLEHAWADFSHERTYKSAFTIPDKWQRELASLAAILEDVDLSFSRLHTGMKAYATQYESYLTPEKMRDELQQLELVRTYDPENVQLVRRIARLAVALGDCQKAIDVLSAHPASGSAGIQQDLGTALCQQHKPGSPDYQQGQRYLEQASAPPHTNAHVLTVLAGTWRRLHEQQADPAHEQKAREYYRQAFEQDPTDPYPLGHYLFYEIADRKDLLPVSLLRPVIQAAMQRCREQIEVGMNLPWAFYDLGRFYLVLDQPYDSLAAYAKAVQLTPSDWIFKTILHSLDQLSSVKSQLSGYEWIRRWLLVGRAARFPSPEANNELAKLATPQPQRPFTESEPVIIVAGGCDPRVEMQMQGYAELLQQAFKGFQGILIGGGTTAGISGLVGQLQECYPESLYTIAYLPQQLPVDGVRDERYRELRETEGDGFTALQPLQGWIDLLAAGIRPDQVKLFGINGGTVAAAEFRLALALGACVAVLEGSGREAARLLPDENWGTSDRLLHLPADPMLVTAFVGSGGNRLTVEKREQLGQAIHDNFRQIRVTPSADPSMAEWPDLREDLKESNRQQADHIFEKLRQIGCSVFPVRDRPVARMTFTDQEIEQMAEMEHARWVVERLRNGWTLGERDVARKISPYLVPWEALSEEVKEWDRDPVRKIPEFLAKVGLEIRRLS